MTTEQASKLKIIGGAIVVLAAAGVMLQPLLVYVAGLGRLITFIVTMLLLAYLVTFVIRKMKGKYNKSGDSSVNMPVDMPVDVSINVPPIKNDDGVSEV